MDFYFLYSRCYGDGVASGLRLLLFAVDWGILIGERAQKMALYACVGLAFFLSAVGINAMVAFNKKCGLLPSALCEEAEKKGVVEPDGSRRF